MKVEGNDGADDLFVGGNVRCLCRNQRFEAAERPRGTSEIELFENTPGDSQLSG